jgi:hypothetical protein
MRARTRAARERELFLRVLTHNLMILRRLHERFQQSQNITYARVIRLPRSEQSRDHPGIDTRTSGQQAFE